jgi:hypothetical protein
MGRSVTWVYSRTVNTDHAVATIRVRSGPWTGSQSEYVTLSGGRLAAISAAVMVTSEVYADERFSDLGLWGRGS